MLLLLSKSSIVTVESYGIVAFRFQHLDRLYSKPF
jgi:hypothetical protein